MEDGLLKKRIREKLTEYGYPLYTKGYKYIVDAAAMVFRDEELIYSLTKELYPELGRLHGTSAACVERAMRNTTKIAWERCGFIDKPPTNGELVSKLVSELNSAQKLR